MYSVAVPVHMWCMYSSSPNVSMYTFYTISLLPFFHSTHTYSLTHSLTHSHTHTHTDPTMFTRPPIGERTLSIQLDTSDTLFCEVTSDSGSALSFSWTKDGANFDVDSTRLAYVDPSLTRNGSIRITNVQNEDAGVYVCTVNTMYNGVLAPTIATNPITVTVDGMFLFLP